MNKVKDLLGKTCTSVKQEIGFDGDCIIFTLDDGTQWQLYHEQDCSESVSIEDICGDLTDLVGTPLTMAEESSQSNENPPGVEVPSYQDSFTWTFYRFATVKGYVTIRWYGVSNGYYSEHVSFGEVGK